MKIYKTQQEVEKDIKNGVLYILGDVKFECNISISASIFVNAGDISAGDISARDISARDISAGDISYYAFCTSYNSIKCQSIKGRRNNHQKPICLDGKLTITDEEKVTIQISKSSLQALKDSGIKII